MMPSAAPTQKTYHSIQMLRAVAAIMVVALHACIQAQPFGGRAFPLGNAGVDIFFPISGFVMVVSTQRRTASWRTAARFGMARILRIAPIYWLITLVKIGLVTVRPGSAPETAISLRSVTAAILFTPLHTPTGALAYPPIKPGWTLDLEMFYYALIAAVMPFSRRIALWTPIALVATVAVARLLFPHWPPLTGQFGWGSPLALEFAAGMIVGELALNHAWVGRWPALTVAAGLAIYVLAPASLASAEWGRVFTWGAVGVLFLWASLGAERRVATWRWAKAAMLLGDASYSIYLTHALSQPIITALAAPSIVSVAGWPGLVAVQIIAPTLLAVVFHLLVEKPLTRRLRSWVSGVRVPRPAVAQA
jgi:exopolysaccharide production protein ExoZ